jgi:hypothetical protein
LRIAEVHAFGLFSGHRAPWLDSYTEGRRLRRALAETGTTLLVIIALTVLLILIRASL